MKPKLSILFGTVDRFTSVKALCCSLQKYTPPIPYEIVIVDSSQSQAVLEYAMRHRNIPIRIFRDETRGGYSKAYNKGAQIVQGDYLVWLNDDCVVTPKWAEIVVRFMQQHPQVGVGGIPFKEGQRRCIKQTMYDRYVANFGCISTVLWHRLGGLDENFHSYGAETDLCFRVLTTGLAVVPIPGIEIEHYRIKDTHRAEVLTPHRAESYGQFRDKWRLRLQGLKK